MFVRNLAVAFASGVVFVLPGIANAVPATVPNLISHRAVYDLELKDASDRSGIEGMTGRMVYEFTGSACTGFTSNFRFVTRINTGEETRTTDQQTTNFENPDTGEFKFDTKSFTDEQLDKEVSGEVKSAESGLKVAITKPDAREIDLVASDYPTKHMLDVITHAREGKRFFESRIFDGSEDGDKSLLTTTVVGKQETPAGDDKEAVKAGEFSKTPYWPVTIAYFNENAAGDTSPSYSMSFKLYENGISRGLTMDYGDFSLSGSLSELTMLDKPSCPQ